MLLNGISIKGSYHNKNQDCYASRNIGNAYIPEVYLSSIIIELVGKDTMLEAYSKENTDLVRLYFQ